MNHKRTATVVVLAAVGLLLAGCSSNDPAPAKTADAANPGTATGTVDVRLPPDGPKKPAPAANRTAAAKILHANVQHYRDSLAAGRNTWGSSKFGPWKQQALLDLTYQGAFTKADKQFTADTEPDSINTWRDDIANAADAIKQWAEKNTIDTATQPAPATTDIDKALSEADKDADQVAAGK
ncbi:hypothetical protein DT019_03110 [Streptomyces sp. SDr-06]|uniref:hypothetical protein n=1 Tax=Streptomyces sp. SDr-06 TaxID=2267702 RepID=UPI000DEBF54D|nr:hypothetical protein [Streptomyces sp. SDr-06]RCH70493.1 hypothetical protein DT019_03110 [Streptomyces sp. SDr-06]